MCRQEFGDIEVQEPLGVPVLQQNPDELPVVYRNLVDMVNMRPDDPLNEVDVGALMQNLGFLNPQGGWVDAAQQLGLQFFDDVPNDVDQGDEVPQDGVSDPEHYGPFTPPESDDDDPYYDIPDLGYDIAPNLDELTLVGGDDYVPVIVGGGGVAPLDLDDYSEPEGVDWSNFDAQQQAMMFNGSVELSEADASSVESDVDLATDLQYIEQAIVDLLTDASSEPGTPPTEDDIVQWFSDDLKDTLSLRFDREDFIDALDDFSARWNPYPACFMDRGIYYPIDFIAHEYDHLEGTKIFTTEDCEIVAQRMNDLRIPYIFKEVPNGSLPGWSSGEEVE